MITHERSHLEPIQILAVLENERELGSIRKALDRLRLYYELRNVRNPLDTIPVLTDRSVAKVLPDLILIDHEMPGLESRNLIREIRLRRLWRRIPCFLLVSPGSMSSFDEPEQDGFSGCINKPFHLNGAGPSGSLDFALALLNGSCTGGK